MDQFPTFFSLFTSFSSKVSKWRSKTKDPHVRRLAADVAALPGESKTKAIRKALEERKSRLDLGSAQGEGELWLEFLEREA